jgi:XTP/dITP diphosphohydrolase
MKICFATNNNHKLTELQAIIGNDFELVSLKDIGCTEELEETSDTLEGNSFQKANYVFQKYKIACFADDTGLLVESLNGAPGVYSARYAGEPSDAEKNMKKLLEELKNFENRSAKFKTVITFINQEGSVKAFEGEVSGEITKNKSGKDGFGYDPIFKPENYDITFSEMNMSEKNTISHRGRAVKKLTEYLKSL